MKQLKQILLWLVVLVVVAVVVNYALSYFMPGGAYLEGFTTTSTSTKYPTSVSSHEGKNAIYNLYRLKNNSDIVPFGEVENAIVDISNICPISSNNLTKECFDALVKKFSLNTGTITSPDNVNFVLANLIISVLNRQLGLGYSSLSSTDIENAMKTHPDLSGVCQVAATGTISKECYNALLNAFVINANKDGVVCSTSDVSGTATAPTSLADDIKKTAATIGTSLSNAASTIKPTSDVSGSATAPLEAKCSVEFGKDVVNPQTKAATSKAPDSTCTTTGDLSKTTKTPAVEQGCEFAQKFPKVNVINLRDYVHKDEIPCWSCKL